MDEELWDSVLIDSYTRALVFGGDENWATFWANFEEAPRERVASFLTDEDPQEFSFRSKAGSFEPRHDLVLVEGEESDQLDTDIILDQSYHAVHWDRLPKEWTGLFGPIEVDEVGTWEGRGWDQMSPYLHTINDLGRRRMPYGPREYLLGVLRKDCILMPSGWRILPELTDALASRLTDELVTEMWSLVSASWMRDRDTSHPYPAITFGHTTRPDSYAEFSAPHPFAYWLHKFGRIEVGERTVPLSAFGEAERDALNLLEPKIGGTLIPYFDSLAEDTDLHFSWTQTSAEEEVWGGLFELAWEWTDNFAALRPVWEAGARLGQVPDLVPTDDGPVPIAEIFVTDHPTSASDVDDGHIIILSEETALAWQAAGAQLLADHSELTYDAKLGDPLRLSSLFPELAPILKTRLARRLDALWVQGLKERSGRHLVEPLLAYDHSGLILIDRARFESEGWNSRTKQLLEFLSSQDLIDITAEEAMAKLVSRRVVEARARVRAGSSLEERLLLAVGGSRNALFGQLTEATREAIPARLSDKELAALTLAVHGPTILSRLRDTLQTEGLDPPSRWAGEAALTFVLELGFPPEFAASSNLRRTAEWIVNGPIYLPPLHDYQDDILEGLEKLFESGAGRRRAVVSLPTGGGKTRVAAEAIVRLILNGEGKRTVLWVAQTDELCEQAVQCFRQLWVNVGALEEDLRIVRLWGGQKNPAAPEANEPVVVVASIQTLNARLDVEQLDWLAQPGVVVIDECHHAIAPSYSSLLRWLDVQTGQEIEREEEPPVIGLSATPWRGYDDDESRRLAARFDQRWLPKDQHQLHQDLLERKVLAKLAYHPVRYDKVVELSEAEIRHLDQYKELPESFVERIGADPDRNDRIIESVLNSRASSILLFANSVKHAQYLAARLHLAGCPAAAVSGETDRLARQHFIRRFKSGELKVLCNHSVLTTGFDAPKADMILISRPVLSPVRYMQMVGRGLRGPKNGGTEKCKIVTVEDNILNYRDRLAYHFCRRFFEV
ncbi:DEAD/DEAH box helicase family protein [Sphingomonas sp. HDW15A]|uniref:DEAD/DEAH box helicase family protein n=1 Tax=Sphingomonas sp. HDW15A TaxID=2714942 RepID=UPI001F0E5DF9|nr:DEAD/DEAH box helicase family protein [Sphingomonas sp. HDW15A]